MRINKKDFTTYSKHLYLHPMTPHAILIPELPVVIDKGLSPFPRSSVPE
jgi:hypothetical protein